MESSKLSSISQRSQPYGERGATGEIREKYNNAFEIHQSDDAHYGRIRRYNNLVKSYIINKYISAGDKVVDFGIGDGGDIFKYAKKNISYLRGYDIAEDRIGECTYRHKINDIKYIGIFSVSDLCNDILDHEIVFDIAVSNLVIHYSFENRLFFQRFVRNMATSGALYIIITTLNAQKIRTFHNNQYLTISDLETDSHGVFGNKYVFNLGYIIDGIPEFLVDRKTLLNEFKKYGYTLIEYNSFINVQAAELSVGKRSVKLSKDERDVVGLYVYYVFEKNE